MDFSNLGPLIPRCNDGPYIWAEGRLSEFEIELGPDGSTRMDVSLLKPNQNPFKKTDKPLL